jgi:hypothetical protein
MVAIVFDYRPDVNDVGRAHTGARMCGEAVGMAGSRAAAKLTGAIFVLAAALLLSAHAARAEEQGGYPTAARADYVFACMATNGNNQEALHSCSCAIDVIASVLPYANYEQAETVLRMRRTAGGYLGQEFHTAISNDMVRDLEEAQAEAEVRCF